MNSPADRQADGWIIQPYEIVNSEIPFPQIYVPGRGSLCLRYMALLGRDGMKSTDVTILNLMISGS